MVQLTAEVRRLFEGKNFVFLATLNKDGSPQVTPMWVDTDGTYILVNTAIGRLKQKNVARDKRVALSIVEREDPYNMVAVRGKVVKQATGKAAEKHIDKLAIKYTGKRFKRRPGEVRILLKIKPERVTTW